MVVLETKGMLTAGSNQYLQPDYLSPLSTTLDSKKSPLALLAQTCSHIGADSSKPLPSEKKKDEDKKEKTSPTPADGTRRSPAFKPYESSSMKRNSEDTDEKPTVRPPSSSQSSHQRSPSTSSAGGGSSLAVKEDTGRRSSDVAATSSSASTTPIIRSGLEVLAGHPKDVPLGTYRVGVPPFLPTGYPGLDAHPALRGAPPGLFGPGLGVPGLTSLASSYPGVAATAALYSSAGLPSACLPSTLFSSPFVSYTLVKTAGGGEAVVPVCRDPYCTGCPYSVQNNHLLQSGGACSPSCTQCEQAKAALSTFPGLSSLPRSSLVPVSSLLPPTTAAAAAVAAAASFYPTTASSLLSGPPRPYVCNWIAGDSYCGKRFATSEELLQHLRTHTNTSTSDSAALSLLSNPLHAHALLGSTHSVLHRPGASYPPPTLSPLTAARYHPYSKPPSSPLTTPSALTPTLPGLSPYSPLAAGYPPGYPSPYAGLYPRPPL